MKKKFTIAAALLFLLQFLAMAASAQQLEKVVEVGTKANKLSAVALTANGAVAATAANDGKVYIIGLPDGKIKKVLMGHSDEVTSLAFSGNGKYLVSGSLDETVRVWDWESGIEKFVFDEHSGAVRAIAVHPKLNFVASSGTDLSIHIWDLYEGKLVETINQAHEKDIMSLAFHPSANQLLSGSGDSWLKVWDRSSGVYLPTLKADHNNWVRAVCFSADGQQLLSTGDDSRLKVWDAESGMEVGNFKNNKGWVHSLSADPSGTYAATGAEGKKVVLTELKSGEKSWTSDNMDAFVSSLSFSADGKWLGATSYNNAFSLFNLSALKLEPLNPASGGPDLANVADIKTNEIRVALIIGNSNYTQTSPLKNAVNDAKLMEATLKKLGFDVTVITDGTYEEMKNAVFELGDKAEKADVNLFYYAGHGLEIDGENYLVPVDAAIENAVDVKQSALPLSGVLATLEYNSQALNMCILDACRNNPFPTGKRGGAGLAKVEAPRGTIIAYATDPGSTASDGDGENGLYTSILAQEMLKPQRIEDVFMRTRITVEEQSGQTQRPWEEARLLGLFYLMNEKEDK